LKKPITFFSLCLSLLVLSVQALAWEARVVAVADGDTITVEPPQGGDRVKVRFHGIDCPETKQPYGQTAKGFVSQAVLFKTVDVQPSPQGKDRYGRIVAVVDIPGVGILQERLLEAGLAWVYPQYCKDCGAWEAMEAEARSQRRGLWVDKESLPPWIWRKRKR
jgi:endonuclease YncB( thermonuclease family)